MSLVANILKNLLLLNRHSVNVISPLEKLGLNLKASVILSSLTLLVNLGVFTEVAQAETRQVIVSIDSESILTFSALMSQAEVLAEMTINQQFQADSSLTEVQVIVLGERSGQVVSILSSQITRDTWRRGADRRPWTQYFTAASVLLGYTNPSQVARRSPSSGASSSNIGIGRRETAQRPTPLISTSNSDQDPREAISEAMSNGRISVDEYWDLMDSLD